MVFKFKIKRASIFYNIYISMVKSNRRRSRMTRRKKNTRNRRSKRVRNMSKKQVGGDYDDRARDLLLNLETTTVTDNGITYVPIIEWGHQTVPDNLRSILNTETYLTLQPIIASGMVYRDPLRPEITIDPPDFTLGCRVPHSVPQTCAHFHIIRHNSAGTGLLSYKATEFNLTCRSSVDTEDGIQTQVSVCSHLNGNHNIPPNERERINMRDRILIPGLAGGRSQHRGYTAQKLFTWNKVCFRIMSDQEDGAFCLNAKGPGDRTVTKVADRLRRILLNANRRILFVNSVFSRQLVPRPPPPARPVDDGPPPIPRFPTSSTLRDLDAYCRAHSPGMGGDCNNVTFDLIDPNGGRLGVVCRNSSFFPKGAGCRSSAGGGAMGALAGKKILKMAEYPYQEFEVQRNDGNINIRPDEGAFVDPVQETFDRGMDVAEQQRHAGERAMAAVQGPPRVSAEERADRQRRRREYEARQREARQREAQSEQLDTSLEVHPSGRQSMRASGRPS